MSLYSCERVFIRLLIERLLAASAQKLSEFPWNSDLYFAAPTSIGIPQIGSLASSVRRGNSRFACGPSASRHAPE